MSDQKRQLSIMACGGFDVLTSERQLHGADGVNPETLLIIKEQVEADLCNPCIGCIHEDASDPHLLDFCHYICKE